MNYRQFSTGLIFIFISVLICSCSARGTRSEGVTGTSGITTTSGGTTGTGNAAPTTVAPGSPTTPGTSDRIRPRVADKNEADLWITEKVVLELKQANLSDLASIEVDSKDGIVTLKGSVASSEEAERVIKLVRSVPTVKDVVSELQTKQ